MTMRLLRLLAAFVVLALPVRAEEVSRFDPGRSRIAEADGGLVVEIGLSAPVPWRLVLLAAPPRLVVELIGLDWAGARTLGGAAEAVLLDAAPDVGGASGGHPEPARLVLRLPGPMRVDKAGMAGSEAPLVTVRLAPTDAASFAATATLAAPVEAAAAGAAPARGPQRFVVALDAGHGGRDPGAERDGAREAELMLALARELAAAIDAVPGMEAVLTREADVFVPLSARMSRARAAGADALISLHADALDVGVAEGASVYTLSAAATDRASERMAERHERGDLLSGLDLSGQDDTVATVLMDLARLQTGPAGDRLAAALVSGLDFAGAPLNSRPRREAPLAVLNAADFPSVLVETGFLSSDADRIRLASPDGRGTIVAGLLTGLQLFLAGETGSGD